MVDGEVITLVVTLQSFFVVFLCRVVKAETSVLDAQVLFGADGQPWAKTAEALQRGVVGDGDVTLVLERRSHSSGSP